MGVLSATTLILSVSCGLLAMETTSASSSLDHKVTIARFPSKISDSVPTSPSIYNDNDTGQSHVSLRNIQTENISTSFNHLLGNISTDASHSCTEGYVSGRLNTTTTTGCEAGCNITGNGIRRMRSQYNGYLRQIDYDHYTSIVDWIRFSLYIIATPLLVLTVVAFSRDKKISLSNKFVVSINAFELTSSVFNLVLSIMKCTIGSTHKGFVVWVIASNYCIVCCRRVVYLLNLLLSTQKLFAVARPLKSRYTRLNQVELVFLAGLPVFVFVYHIYLTLMYRVKEIAPMVYVQAPTDTYINNEELFENFGHFSKTVFSYVPLGLTLGVNVALLAFLKQHNEKSKNLRVTTQDTDRSRRDRQMTLMIVVSTLAYTILSLPANINQMLSSFIYSYDLNGEEHYLFSLVKNAVNAAHILGSLSNFITYMSLSSGFRHHVMEILLLFRRTV